MAVRMNGARCPARLAFGSADGAYVQCQQPPRHRGLHRCEWFDPADGRHFVEWTSELNMKATPKE